ncbi:MAG: hypothetical protein K5872_11630 [Rhizobiaceae bacterium]|nr:hypothetical protein [Rhizobiaceae bacterium]MCV0406870.1 hypothetical protein [Rhizobiaceae bacterium]
MFCREVGLGHAGLPAGGGCLGDVARVALPADGAALVASSVRPNLRFRLAGSARTDIPEMRKAILDIKPRFLYRLKRLRPTGYILSGSPLFRLAAACATMGA